MKNTNQINIPEAREAMDKGAACAVFAAAGRYSVSEHKETGKTGSDFCSLKTGE